MSICTHGLLGAHTWRARDRGTYFDGYSNGLHNASPVRIKAINITLES